MGVMEMDPDRDDDAPDHPLDETPGPQQNGLFLGQTIQDSPAGQIHEKHQGQDHGTCHHDVKGAVPLRRQGKNALEDQQAAGHDG